MLRVSRHVGRVEQRDGQRHGPDPNHLKDPEPQEWQELAALIVEAVIFACFEDPVEQKAGEADGPDNDEEPHDQLARVVVSVAQG